jgi:hypothetical protein
VVLMIITWDVASSLVTKYTQDLRIAIPSARTVIVVVITYLFDNGHAPHNSTARPGTGT